MGREADVGADGNLRIDDGLNHVFYLRAPLELHGVGVAFCDKAAGVYDAVANAGGVGQKGHVANNQGMFCASCHGGGVVDHVL